MDKIEKIRAEIERLIGINKTKNGFPAGTLCAVRIEAYEKLLSFLDTLGEEPDRDLEEAAENIYKTPFGTRAEDFIAGAEWMQDQFEKNRLAHCDKLTKEEYDLETDFAMEIIEKEHRQPTFTDAINYGMRIMKDQMMKEAVEGFVGLHLHDKRGDVTVNSGYLPKELGIRPEDKVKLIVIKEG